MTDNLSPYDRIIACNYENDNIVGSFYSSKDFLTHKMIITIKFLTSFKLYKTIMNDNIFQKITKTTCMAPFRSIKVSFSALRYCLKRYRHSDPELSRLQTSELLLR